MAASSASAAQPVDTAPAGSAATPYAFPIPRNAAAIAAQCKTLLADLKQTEAQLVQGSEPPGTALLAAGVLAIYLRSRIPDSED